MTYFGTPSASSLDMAVAAMIEGGTKPLPTSAAGDAVATATPNASGTESFQCRWQALVAAQGQSEEAKPPTSGDQPFTDHALSSPSPGTTNAAADNGPVVTAKASLPQQTPQGIARIAFLASGHVVVGRAARGTPTETVPDFMPDKGMRDAIKASAKREKLESSLYPQPEAAAVVQGTHGGDVPTAMATPIAAQAEPVLDVGDRASAGTVQPNLGFVDATATAIGSHQPVCALETPKGYESIGTIPVDGPFVSANGATAHSESQAPPDSMHPDVSLVGTDRGAAWREPNHLDARSLEQSTISPASPDGNNAPTSNEAAGAQLSHAVSPQTSLDGRASAQELSATAVASSPSLNSAPASVSVKEPPAGASIPAAAPGVDAQALPLPNAKSNSPRGVRSMNEDSERATGQITGRITERNVERTVHVAGSLMREDGIAMRVADRSENPSLNPILLQDAAVMTMGSGSSRTAGLPVAAASGGGFSSRDTLAALDATTNLPATTWVQAGARHAEVGYQDPALGWVGVRAQSDSTGVHAALVPGSAEAAQALNSHSSGLNAYIAEHHGQGSTVTMAAPEADFAGRHADRGDGMPYGSGQQQGNHDGQNTDSGQPNRQPVTASNSRSTVVWTQGAASKIDGFISTAERSGTHISVMA